MGDINKALKNLGIGVEEEEDEDDPLARQERLLTAPEPDDPTIVEKSSIAKALENVTGGSEPEPTIKPDIVEDDVRTKGDVAPQRSAFAKPSDPTKFTPAGPETEHTSAAKRWNLIRTIVGTIDAGVQIATETAGVLGGAAAGAGGLIGKGIDEASDSPLSLFTPGVAAAGFVRDIAQGNSPFKREMEQDNAELKQLSWGESFLRPFNSVLEPMTYHATTDEGQAIIDTLEIPFEVAETWGDNAGDFVLDKTDSPLAATIADTAVTGTPYMIAMLVPGGISRIRPLAKEDASKRVKRIEEAVEAEKKARQDEVLAFAAEDSGRFKMQPSEIFESSKRPPPTEEMILNEAGVQDMEGLLARFRKSPQRDPILLMRQEDGSLDIVGNRVEAYARSKLSNKPIDVMIVERLDPRSGKPVIRADGKPAKDAEESAKILDKDSKEVETYFDDVEEAKNAKPSKFAGTAQAFLDQDAGMKKRLLDSAGDAGKLAVQKYELTAGASPRAILKFQKAEDKVYGDTVSKLGALSREDTVHLDQIILSERIRQIDRRRGVGTVKHPKGLNSIKVTNHLNKLRGTLGPEKYAMLQARAQEYFKTMRHQLDELYAEGIISKDTLDNLKNDVYEPRRLIKAIDKERTFEVDGQKISVSDSGLKPLGEGTLDLMETDSRELLAEYMIRVQNRIMKNKANKQLGEVADVLEDTDDKFIRKVKVERHTKRGEAIVKGKDGEEGQPKPPKGWVRIDYMEDGKQQPLFVEGSFAKNWALGNQIMDEKFAKMMRVASGSFIVKPLATGFNPGFAVVDFPRNMMHAYMATDQFSVRPFKFMFQYARDLKVTAKDAWKKSGAYEDYINEGGGMNFLTHQGRDINPLKTDPGGREIDPRWRHVKEFLSKINETSEIWGRLAIRNRALRNGLDPEKATHVARSSLDYSQGGWVTKGLDHGVPYINAASQALRTTMRGAANGKDRGRFAAKVALLNVAAFEMQVAAFLSNPEAMREIPERERRANWILPLPPMFSYTDPETGARKHRYMRVRKDNTMIPFLAAAEIATEKYLYGINPTKETIGEIVDQATPINPTGINAPTLDMLLSYRSNYDNFFNDKIWYGDKLTGSEEQEFTINTPPIWVEFGSMTGMSPVRAQRAFSKMFPSNTFMDMTLAGMNRLTEGGMTLAEQQQTAGEMFTRLPLIKKLVSETHPMAQREIGLEEAIGKSDAIGVKVRRDVDTLHTEVRLGNKSPKQIDSLISSIDDIELKKMAQRRWKAQRSLDQVFGDEDHIGIFGFPRRQWFLGSSNIDNDKVRAEFFYEEWRQHEPAERRKMERIIQGLTKAGVSYNNPGFGKHFNRLKQERGVEVR